MATTWTRERVTINRIEVDLATVEEALREATSGIHYDLDDSLPDGHPAGMAFDRDVLDPAASEIRDEVVGLLRTAIERRLPWTWER